jgi:orotidine-5'-phosphate decarboxylase
MQASDPESAEAVATFGRAFLDRVAERVAIVKPQSGFFEQLGWRGMQVLDGLVREARARNLLVLLDAKRGDIGSTAEGYALAYLGANASLPADAMTVNPWLGLDALEPFVARAVNEDAGLFVLTRTSNPGGNDFQGLEVGGRPLYERVASALAPAAKRLLGPSTGWSGLGLVVGATAPEEARRVREAAPTSLFLIPGYGAQGADARAAVAGLVRRAGGRLEGGVVSSSRALHFPPARGDSLSAWERAVDEVIDRAGSELAAATLG